MALKEKEKEMSKERNIDDAELNNISGAGDGNMHPDATDKIPPASVAEDSESKPPAGGSGGGGAPSGLESDAETGGNEDFGIG
jgi:hypothetical protein